MRLLHRKGPERKTTNIVENQSIDGAQGRDRTTDTAIFSRMLYQLSYLGTSANPRTGVGERRFIVRPGSPVHHASPWAVRGAAMRTKARRVRHSPQGDDGRSIS